MRLHYLQHAAFEDAANIAVWAAERGHTVTRTRLDLDERLPPINAIDWLVVMGGPMNIYDHQAYPWLAREKAFIRRVIDRGSLVLGVCLGAQLIADVLGGAVTRNRRKEIGWFPVALTDTGSRSRLFRGFPQRFTAFHWHGDAFSTPPGAIRLAESAGCDNQAFQYGERVLGLQFHLDYSAASIEQMIRHCAEELVMAPGIQRTQEMLPAKVRVKRLCGLLYRLLDTMERTPDSERGRAAMGRTHQIRTKRVYEQATDEDGVRYLVDRLWPRGVKKSGLRLDEWLKDVAPSDSLRRWFGHDESRWAEFQRRYSAELDEKPDVWQPILNAAARGTVTLVFAARAPETNHAVALKQYLDAKA